MASKLSPEHEHFNQGFVWPAQKFPSSIQEAMELWQTQPPHARIFQQQAAASMADLERFERKYKTLIPEPYKLFLQYSDGLKFAWSGNCSYLFSLDELEDEWENWREETKVIWEELRSEYAEDWKLALLPDLDSPEKVELRKFFPIGRDVNDNLYLLYTGIKIRKHDYPVFVYSADVYEIKLKNSCFANYIWFLNLYGHTHPQERDTRLLAYREKDIDLKID